MSHHRKQMPWILLFNFTMGKLKTNRRNSCLILPQ